MYIERHLVRYQSPKYFKLLIGFWLISMFALINSYTSVMTALLTVPKLEPIANTLEEAAIQNRVVTIETNTPISKIISVRLLHEIDYYFEKFDDVDNKKGCNRRM